MILSMWQDDIAGVARSIDACLEGVYTSVGPPVGDQAFDQLRAGWKDVMVLLPSGLGPSVKVHLPLLCKAGAARHVKT